MNRGERGRDGGLSRREVLAAGVAGAAALWLPSFRIDRAFAGADCAVPPEFPGQIELYRQGFENWALTIVVDDVWTCAPRSAAEVAEVANWARRKGYTVRPRGAMHGWSPFTVARDHGCDDRVVLVDLMTHMNGVRMASQSPPVVRAGGGATMEAILSHLEAGGFGLTSVPATGAPTVAGVLAIGGHGASVPAKGERRRRGQTYGSLSNLVVSIRAVVWDERRRRYVARRFHRDDPACSALLVNLGRVIVTDVELRAVANQNLRCRSYTDIPATELFAAPGSPGRTFAGFIDETGRAEAIWFPFTSTPWFKTWQVSPSKPASSKTVTGPYNYPFSDNIPVEVSELADQLIGGAAAVTPLYAQVASQVAAVGLDATATRDLWGPAKNTQLYIRATTLRVDEIGYAIVTRRRDIQRVLHDFTTFYTALLDEYADRGEYPVNNPMELRVSGIDRPRHAGVPGAVAPAISPSAPVRGRAEWDSVVWINLLTFPGTPGAYGFFRRVERHLLNTYRGGDALARPEWSKGWAYTAQGDFQSRQVLRERIPRRFAAPTARGRDWDGTRRTLERLDPHGVFASALHRRLLG